MISTAARIKEITGGVEEGFHLRPDDARFLLAQLEAKEKTIEAVREWGQQFEHWTPEEHDAFLVALGGSN